MNGKHRASWLSEIISEVQRYVKQASKRPCAEIATVQQALNKLFEARDQARSFGEAEPGDGEPGDGKP